MQHLRYVGLQKGNIVIMWWSRRLRADGLHCKLIQFFQTKSIIQSNYTYSSCHDLCLDGCPQSTSYVSRLNWSFCLLIQLFVVLSSVIFLKAHLSKGLSDWTTDQVTLSEIAFLAFHIFKTDMRPQTKWNPRKDTFFWHSFSMLFLWCGSFCFDC